MALQVLFEGILNKMKEVDDVSRNDINLVFFFFHFICRFFVMFTSFENKKYSRRIRDVKCAFL